MLTRCCFVFSLVGLSLIGGISARREAGYEHVPIKKGQYGLDDHSEDVHHPALERWAYPNDNSDYSRKAAGAEVGGESAHRDFDHRSHGKRRSGPNPVSVMLAMIITILLEAIAEAGSGLRDSQVNSGGPNQIVGLRMGHRIPLPFTGGAQNPYYRNEHQHIIMPQIKNALRSMDSERKKELYEGLRNVFGTVETILTDEKFGAHQEEAPVNDPFSKIPAEENRKRNPFSNNYDQSGSDDGPIRFPPKRLAKMGPGTFGGLPPLSSSMQSLPMPLSSGQYPSALYDGLEASRSDDQSEERGPGR